ncbi:MAG: hypothetical protein U9N47_06970 [Thermodesulfobacteriota bacterium]|nr:hypothetical protein [Thermodesulfobacteriota bacterium]
MSEDQKSPFVAIAWSRYLLYILAATAIWGFFPLFLHFMGNFPSEFPSVYLFLRYLCTTMIFLIILIIFFHRALPSVWQFIKSRPRSLFYGGIILFSARFFETLAFEQNIVTFAVIFSVAFVPLLEPVVVYFLYRPRITRWIFYWFFGKEIAIKMASISDTKENYWIEYVITLAIIFSAAMFFIYGMQGNFAIFYSDVPFYAYGFVILAAMFLQLYFHALDFGFEGIELDLPKNDRDVKNKWSEKINSLGPSVIKQNAFAFIITVSCFFWVFLSRESVTKVLGTVESPVLFWLFLGGGIVFLGSVVAYVWDNFGFDGYEQEKENLPFKIRGVEWLGISTLMDPMVSNILTAFFPALAETGGQETKPVFFFISLAMIIMLVVLKVLMMRYTKLHEFKVFCFSLLRSRRTSGEPIEPNHFSSVALIRHLKSIRNKEDKFGIRELYRFKENDVPKNELDKHLQYQLWLFNSSHLEIRKAIAVWVMKEGKPIYDAEQLFERLLFHEHMRNFCTKNHIRDGRILLFFPDKLRFDENRLIELVEKETGKIIEENDQVFYFLDLTEYERISEHIQQFIEARWEFLKDHRQYQALQNEVMMKVLKKG